MALTITGRLICGTDTPHVAEPLADESGLWRVSWLPGRELTQSQAVSAMLIAQAAGRGLTGREDRRWPHVEGWAGELRLSGPRCARPGVGAAAGGGSGMRCNLRRPAARRAARLDEVRQARPRSSPTVLTPAALPGTRSRCPVGRPFLAARQRPGRPRPDPHRRPLGQRRRPVEADRAQRRRGERQAGHSALARIPRVRPHAGPLRPGRPPARPAARDRSPCRVPGGCAAGLAVRRGRGPGRELRLHPRGRQQGQESFSAYDAGVTDARSGLRHRWGAAQARAYKAERAAGCLPGDPPAPVNAARFFEPDSFTAARGRRAARLSERGGERVPSLPGRDHADLEAG